jgi:hypothetical protein
MKKIAFIALFALSACSQAEEPAPEETATEAAAPTAADGGAVAGVYEVTGPDGTVLTQTVNADGTVTSDNAAGETTAGTDTGGGGGEPYCLTQPNAEGAQEPACYVEAIGEDGVWTPTNQDDPEDVWTVVRVR